MNMRIVMSTDNKYIGHEVSSDFNPGDLITLGDFIIPVQYIRRLDNGHVSIVSTNYQLECEE